MSIGREMGVSKCNDQWYRPFTIGSSFFSKWPPVCTAHGACCPSARFHSSIGALVSAWMDVVRVPFLILLIEIAVLLLFALEFMPRLHYTRNSNRRLKSASVCCLDYSKTHEETKLSGGNWPKIRALFRPWERRKVNLVSFDSKVLKKNDSCWN